MLHGAQLAAGAMAGILPRTFHIRKLSVEDNIMAVCRFP